MWLGHLAPERVVQGVGKASRAGAQRGPMLRALGSQQWALNGEWHVEMRVREDELAPVCRMDLQGVGREGGDLGGTGAGTQGPEPEPGNKQHVCMCVRQRHLSFLTPAYMLQCLPRPLSFPSQARLYLLFTAHHPYRHISSMQVGALPCVLVV